MKKYIKITLILLSLYFYKGNCLYAQSFSSNGTKDTIGPLNTTAPKDTSILLGALKRINFSGYYRFFFLHRYQPVPFYDIKNYPRAVSVGEGGFREPILDLAMSFSPTARTNAGTEIYIFSAYPGAGFENYNNDNVSLYLGLNVNGSIKTKAGTFNARVGFSWVRLSLFTLYTNRAYNRFSIFDRNPWEPVLRGIDRYDNYYKLGQLYQDQRWDRQAFNGVVLDGVELPKNVSFSLLYGKTINNGGGFSYLKDSIPNFSYGGRIQKLLKDNSSFVAVNTFHNELGDSLTERSYKYGVISTDFACNIKGLILTGEVGGGYFSTPQQKEQWSEAINLKLLTSKRHTFLPLDINFYRIGKNMVNQNAGFLNTTVRSLNPQGGLQNGNYIPLGNLNPFDNPLVELGQYTNNRTGVNLNTTFDIGRLKVTLGNGVARQIEANNNTISYYHRVNGLAWSRFAQYYSGIGAYGRISSIFRGVYQTDTIKNYQAKPLNFNVSEIQLKYKTWFLKKELILFYLSSLNSIQNKVSGVPLFTDQAYLRAQYHEFELYYRIFPKIVISGYGGLELVSSNKDMTIDKTPAKEVTIASSYQPSLKPLSQINQGFGVGADIEIGNKAGLFVRQRWYNFRDKNFQYERFKGFETTIELKLFF